MPVQKSEIRILITDDSIVSRKKLKNMLKDTTYQIDFAADGREALEKISEGTVDIMLLDLLMPDIDGIEVLKKLQADSNTLPVIVVSADIQEATKTECLEYGARHFLNKPPDKAELLTAVSDIVSEITESKQ